LYQQPDASQINRVILVPKAIADTTYFPPGNFWLQHSGGLTEPRRRFANDHQRVFDGKDRLLVRDERLCIQVPRESLDMIDILDDVGKRWTGSLEGTHRLAFHALPHTRLQCPLLHQIHRLSEQIGNQVLDPEHVQQ
jgi:hypothetical protein